MDNLTAQFLPEKHHRKIYSVSLVNRIAKETLENFSCWVHGEVAELEKINPTGGAIFPEQTASASAIPFQTSVTIRNFSK